MSNESYRSELIRLETIELSALVNSTMQKIRELNNSLKTEYMFSPDEVIRLRTARRYLRKLRVIQLKELKSRQMKLF